jgi:hypothetical protein
MPFTTHDAKIPLETLDGRTPIEAFFNIIRENDNVHDQQFDEQGRFTSLFFSHTFEFPTVLVMNCTYKTNKFKMPLLNVVRVTACNTTYFLCFAFLS